MITKVSHELFTKNIYKFLCVCVCMRERERERERISSELKHLIIFRNCELEECPQEGEGILSPLDEDSSADSDQNKPNNSADGKENDKVEENTSDTEIEPGE